MESSVKLGKYRHFKGNEYELIAIGKNSENPEELLAIYKALYGDGEIWVRPLSMWSELVEFEGKTISRFEYIGDLQRS